MIRILSLIAFAVIVTACSDSAVARVTLTIDTIGDTIVVRNSGNGTWGDSVSLVQELRIGELEGADEYTFGQIGGIVVDQSGTMYVLDRQALTVRRFDAAGKHINSFGRPGAGPGELGNGVSGMAFLPDGRFLVRDFRNARINIYSAVGEPLGQLPIPGGFFTSSPMTVDSTGNIYTHVVADRSADGTFSAGLLKLNPSGAVLDTLRDPNAGFKVPVLIAHSPDGSGTASYNPPFSAQTFWLVDGAGRIISGITDRYAIELRMSDGKIRRIEREVPPVPIAAGEAATAKERTTRSLRQTDPGWNWSGPGMPDTKPPIREVRIAADGRLWVQRAAPAVRQPPDTTAQREPGSPPPLDLWVEPIRYDVFEPDGQFLGTVTPPDRFRIMYMRGLQMWGVLPDENDVPYIVRLRLALAN